MLDREGLKRRGARTLRLTGMLFLTPLLLSSCSPGNTSAPAPGPGPSPTPAPGEPMLPNDLIRGCAPLPGAMPPPPGRSRPGAPSLSEAMATVGLMEGARAVNFTLKDVNGNEFVLSKLLAEKPVVMLLGSFT